MTRLPFILLIGVLGTAILIALGVWQVQRLEWKEGVLAQIDARVSAAPLPIPADANEAAHEYMPVRVSGHYQIGEIHALVSTKQDGPGYRIIAPFLTVGGQRILVDRGFVPSGAKDARRPVGAAELTGNLLWPDEIDGYTPAPNLGENIWFARDLPAMAESLGTEPILLVLARSPMLGAPKPLPVTIAIPNNHLSYAVTWFGLALVWAGMSGLFIWRTRRGATEETR